MFLFPSAFSFFSPSAALPAGLCSKHSSASPHTCLLLHVSAVLLLISAPLCGHHLCVCMCVSLQHVHQPSHYGCLFLHPFASLSTKHSHWGQQASTLVPIFPLSLWLCVCVCQSVCARRVLSASPLLHITLFPCIRRFPSFASSSSPVYPCSWEPKFPYTCLNPFLSFPSYIC